MSFCIKNPSLSNGSPGAPGSVIRNGNGVPSNGLGINGDYYIDDITGFLYFKAASVYGVTGVILQGSVGPSGAAGAVIRFGSGAPSSGLGINGDYYLDQATYNFYNKSAGVYAVVGNLKGADGSVMRNGNGAPSSGLGANGDYYIDNTTDDLYFKTAGSYAIIANIKGNPGANGSVIRNGSGVPSNGLGANGDYYIDNDTDNLYFKASGTYSIITNLQGSPGVDGSTMRNGNGAPSDGVGNDGDYYIDNTTDDLYFKTSGHYNIITNLKGTTGDTGFGIVAGINVVWNQLSGPTPTGWADNANVVMAALLPAGFNWIEKT